MFKFNVCPAANFQVQHAERVTVEFFLSTFHTNTRKEVTVGSQLRQYWWSNTLPTKTAIECEERQVLADFSPTLFFVWAKISSLVLR